MQRVTLPCAPHAAAAGGILGGGELRRDEQRGHMVELLLVHVPNRLANTPLAQIECPDGAHIREMISGMQRRWQGKCGHGAGNLLGGGCYLVG